MPSPSIILEALTIMALISSNGTEILAANVHPLYRSGVAAQQPSSEFAMNREYQIRFTAGFLVLFTTAAITLAWINFRKESQFIAPYDGAVLVERGAKVIVDQVEPNGPAGRSGIKAGDRLIAVDGHPVSRTETVIRQMYQDGAWSKITYSLMRGSTALEATPILVPMERSSNDWLRLIALIYLGIGLYVLFRRWTAPGSTHFYIFCLVSFVLYSFHYTGKLNLFDWTIYWGNVVAGLLQAALFVHFVLTFPEEHGFARKRRWAIPALYLPGILLLAVHILALTLSRASETLRWQIDRLEMSYMAIYFVSAAAVLLHSYRQAKQPILRQQLKWLTRGTILAITPFTLFYVIPYLIGIIPTPAMKVSVLSLGILPLTFGYAIFRYRLMDVDLIFKRGAAYTLAALAIAGAYFGMVAVIAYVVQARMPSLGRVGLVLLIVVTALLFDPVRGWIEERIDRLFYRTRYDYRHTLIEFGRELNAETDLDKMLTAVVDQLSRTLLVDRMAIFLASGEQDRFLLAKSFGIQQTGGLDLGFLSETRPETGEGHIFFENTHRV